MFKEKSKVTTFKLYLLCNKRKEMFEVTYLLISTNNICNSQAIHDFIFITPKYLIQKSMILYGIPLFLCI